MGGFSRALQVWCASGHHRHNGFSSRSAGRTKNPGKAPSEQTGGRLQLIGAGKVICAIKTNEAAAGDWQGGLQYLWPGRCPDRRAGANHQPQRPAGSKALPRAQLRPALPMHAIMAIAEPTASAARCALTDGRDNTSSAVASIGASWAGLLSMIPAFP